MESIKIVESEIYQTCIQNLQDKLILKVLNKYTEMVAKRDQAKLTQAQLTSEEIFNILLADNDRFTAYVFSKINKFQNVKLKEEYPKGEEPAEESVLKETLGYARSFLLLYAIEYYILKERPDDLEAYVKYCRIPDAKKYTKDLKNIYLSI